MERRNYALIMAGGQGTRFWPWSTVARPKQFLPVAGVDSLLTQTYRRLRRFIAADKIFVIAEKRYRRLTAEVLPDLPEENYIVEPAPRNTAPSMMMANIVLARREPEARLLVVPADHFIPDEEIYARQMSAALKLAEGECIVTAGIRPTLPHTGYGYIRFDAAAATEIDGESFHLVLEFKEKPDRRTAQSYLEQGNYYWNAGMFVYRLDHFRLLLQRYNPYYGEQYALLEKARPGTFAELFSAIKPDSIDFALMEKVKEARLIKAAFFWSDVGSWSSLMEIGERAEAGNVLRGDPVLLDVKDSLVYAMGARPVAVLGLKSIVVVDTPSGLLVSSIENLQRIKDVFPQIKAKKPD